MRPELLELQAWGQGSHPPGGKSGKTSCRRQHWICISALQMGGIFFLVTNSFVFDSKKEVICLVESLESIEECKEENKSQLLSSPNKLM